MVWGRKSDLFAFGGNILKYLSLRTTAHSVFPPLAGAVIWARRPLWLLPLVIVIAAGLDLLSHLQNSPPEEIPVRTQMGDPRQVVEQLQNRLFTIGANDGWQSNLQLVAVSSGTAKIRGWAVLADEGGRQTAYLEGEEIRSGIRLLKVLSNEVEIGFGEDVRRISIQPVVSHGDAGGEASSETGEMK